MNIRFHLKNSWTEHEKAYVSCPNYAHKLAGYFVQGYETAVPYIDFSSTQMEDAKQFRRSFRELITFITIRATMAVHPQRIRGKYALGKAEADLDTSASPKVEYELLLTSTSLDDAIKLVDLIHGGKILPVESWEEPQIKPAEKKPRKHLRERTRPYFRLGKRPSIYQNTRNRLAPATV
jgi:hypothetical protein